MSELTEWVIITMLVTGAGMFFLSVGFALTYLYYVYKKLYPKN